MVRQADHKTRYRLRLAAFWGGIGAAVILALTTGVTSWQNYMKYATARYQLRAHMSWYLNNPRR
jgi:hypothetical protein